MITQLNFVNRFSRATLLFVMLFCSRAHADVLTDSSFGDIEIGMNESTAKEILSDYVTDEENYEEPYECHYLEPPGNKIGGHYMIIKGLVVRVDFFDKELNIATEEGVGIGSSKSDILEAYQNAEVSPHPYISPDGEYIEVKLPNGNGIIFETEHDVVTSFRLGSYPAVGYIEGCL